MVRQIRSTFSIITSSGCPPFTSLVQSSDLDDLNHPPAGPGGERITVAKLVDQYIKARLQPAEYHGERKIAGPRSYQTLRQHAATIKNFFGSKLLKGITPSDLETYKQLRLKQPTIRGSQRTITSVNRELETLRAMLTVISMITPQAANESGLCQHTDAERLYASDEEARNDQNLPPLCATCNKPELTVKMILVGGRDT